MNRIEQKFRKLKKEGQKALIAFITCGDPNLTTTARLAQELDRLGVDILELGVPFSDPLADGPTIQAASQRALKNKVNLKSVLRLVKQLRQKTALPIVLLTYFNVVFHFGLEAFVQQAKRAGVDGVVIPDLPVEEAGQLSQISRREKFANIFLLAPTSDLKRIKKICASSTGFIYYVSLTGTTGARQALPKELINQVRRVKRNTAKPVCVGFGVSSVQQAKDIARVADGVIVGSAFIKIIAKNLGSKELVPRIVSFAKRLRSAI
ncbi:tryptophan synthase subunit alpha [Candidatus Omnitrophota bacterium]